MPATRKALALLGPLLLTFAVVPAEKDKTRPAQMPQDKQVIHALNRFTFGIRPGDVERVRAMGLDKWFEQQLHPTFENRLDALPFDDDPLVEKARQQLSTIS